jgi:hypothetical protein
MRKKARRSERRGGRREGRRERGRGKEGRARPKIEKVNQDLFIALYQLLRLIPLFPPPYCE